MRDFLETARQAKLVTENFPIPGQEDHSAGCNELLQRPSASMPLALSEGGFLAEVVVVGRDVREVDITNVGQLIIAEHRVDRLTKLSAARLVDAARVRPCPGVPVLLCEDEELPDLRRDAVAGVCRK